MGNTSRRPTRNPSSNDRSSSKGVSTNVDVKTLASKNVLHGGDAECPICFVTYEEYNSAICCRQNICTDCFLQIKTNDSAATCPFCGGEGFSVSFERAINQVKIDSKEKSQALPSTTIQQTYTTPEQEKKLRSTSFDQTGTPVASKADREAIEAEILKQRAESLVYDQSTHQTHTFHSPTTTRSNSLPTRSNSSSTTPSRFQRSSTGRPPMSSNSNQHHSPYAETRRRDEGRNMPPMPPSSYIDSDFLVDEDDSADFLSDDDAQLIAALQSILTEANDTPSMPSSLEQLEEMMVMEAIRQSMRETQETTQSTVDDAAITSSIGGDQSLEPEVVHETYEGIAANSAVPLPIPSTPERPNSRRLLEDIERALNTPPRPPTGSR